MTAKRWTSWKGWRRSVSRPCSRTRSTLPGTLRLVYQRISHVAVTSLNTHRDERSVRKWRQLQSKNGTSYNQDLWHHYSSKSSLIRKTGLLNAMKFAGQVELLFSIAWLEYFGWLNGIYFDIGWDITLHGVLLSMAGWNCILALLLDGMTTSIIAWLNVVISMTRWCI